MENLTLPLEQAITIEKITDARIVAFSRFPGIQEVGRQIWMVRDWIITAGYQQTGYPSCLYDLAGSGGSSPRDCLCEVQWDLLPTWAYDSRGGPDPFPIQAPGESIRVKRLGSERVLSILHWGDTDGIEQTIHCLEQALRTGVYQKCGPRREIYRFDLHYPKSRWVTEIQIPVMREV